MTRPAVITAGATRNPIDAIRFISAFSTGRTGAALADALAPHGPVTLLGSAEACLRLDPAAGALPQEYRSTRDLMAKLVEHIRARPRAIVVHAAAVGDYEVADAAGKSKIPSGSDELILRLTPTPKILDRLKPTSEDIRLVSFKAAAPETTDQQLADIARRQRERTRSDLVFANVLGRLSSRVLLLGEQPRWFDSREDAITALTRQLRAWQDEEGPRPGR